MAPGFAAIVPYTVALVELDAGVRMIGRILAPPEDIAIGDRVEAAYEAVTAEVTLVHWHPSQSVAGEFRQGSTGSSRLHTVTS